MTAIAYSPSPTRQALQFELHGLVLRLVCDEARILDALAVRFAELAPSEAVQPDLTFVYDTDGRPHEPPRDGRLVYESELAKAIYSPGEDALYAFAGGGASMRCEPAHGRTEIVCGPPADARGWLVTRPLPTLALMESFRARGLHPIHAAVLARGGAGVLVCGGSGSGKSTLSLALLEAGLDFLGDDLAFVRSTDAGIRILGFPDELGLSAKTSALVPALARGLELEPQPGWPKARVPLRRAAPAACVADSCEPRLVLVLSDGCADGVVEEIDRDTALLELLPNILLTAPERCNDHLAALAKLAASATLWRTSPRPRLAAISQPVVRALQD